MRTVQLQVDGRTAGNWITFHAALGQLRNPPAGAMLVADNDVLCRSFGGKWELEINGISALLEEMYSPLYEQYRNG